MSKSAFVAIVGRPNVGKSSLLNTLVGKKVAIVSDKPQTTRNRIMGIVTKDDLQLVFLDTPGAHKPRTRLGDFMVKSIAEAVSGVDAGVLVIEPTTRITDTERDLIRNFRSQKLPLVLVINKIDTVEDKAALLAVIEAWQEEFGFAAIVPLSAQTGEAVDSLWDELSQFAFDSPHFFDDDATSDQPEKVIAAELIREQILLQMRDEIPHGVAVVIESLSERETEKGWIVDVDAYIYCERDSHKGMLIGKKGARLREIASASRLQMEELFDSKVNLQCWIKVKEDWRNRQGLLNGFGYVNP